ncbi:MAG TPA: hypothetical protein VG097_20570 [Gemmata sp.]|jgi:hypothetical protein|nr:hypothetical protein [Gemmata sp.]
MAPHSTQNCSASNQEEAWQDFLDLIAWPSEGGKVPLDEDAPEPPIAPSAREHAVGKELTNTQTRGNHK